jgi:hypothetical protein
MISIVAGASIIACTSFSEETDPQSRDEAGAGSDAMSTLGADATMGSDGGTEGDGATEGGSVSDVNLSNDNLLRNPGFEQGTTYWTPNTVLFTDDTMCHVTGSHSGKVCETGGASSWSVSQGVIIPGGAVVGHKYQGSAWFRTPVAGDGIATATAGCRIEVQTGGSVLQFAEDIQMPVDATWSKCSVTLEVDISGAGAATVHMMIISRTNSGCFMVDDATLKPLP